ncbi:Condensation domain-containing protein [Bacillus sp. OV322]|uniref:condensation domain-containing protein n=1 Tax=Bacillus sp. OV322 TaxID=1882764 RepID=UPI0008F394BD|nr:condensation domain-containing protein [Bacillus sp. OV322]SFC55815.1 Condensation domain-containing protein [Bacillus sp. OV322]
MLTQERLHRDTQSCDEMIELTAMQRKMFICNKLPLYRLPVIYDIEGAVTDDEISGAAYRTMKKYTALQMNYHYDPAGRKFYQKFVPLTPDHFSVESIETETPIERYVKNSKLFIDLTEQYPWRLQLVKSENKRYLYIEFHHICIDGLGIRNFEKSFLQFLSGDEPDVPGEFDGSAYQLIRSAEDKNGGALDSLDMLRIPAAKAGKHHTMERVEVIVDMRRLQIIDHLSRSLHVTKNACYQGILEEALVKHCPGSVYGTVGNWRMHSRNFSEIGCLVSLHPKKISSKLSLLEKITQGFIDQLAIFHKKEMESFHSIEFPIVYSYEENMFSHFRFIPVDQLCKFDVYFRINISKLQTSLEAEYNSSKYREQDIREICEEFFRLLDSMGGNIVGFDSQPYESI